MAPRHNFCVAIPSPPGHRRQRARRAKARQRLHRGLPLDRRSRTLLAVHHGTCPRQRSRLVRDYGTRMGKKPNNQAPWKRGQGQGYDHYSGAAYDGRGWSLWSGADALRSPQRPPRPPPAPQPKAKPTITFPSYETSLRGNHCRHHRDPFYCHLHRWKTERWLGERCAICSEHCKEGRPATTSAPQGQRAQGTQLECLASTDVSLLSLGEAALSSRTITPRQRHQGCRDSAGRGLCRSEICNSDLWPIHRKCGKRAERTRGSHGRRGRGDRRRSGYRVGTHFGLLRPISCQRSSCSHSQAKHRRRAHDTCSWCPSLSPQGAGPHARAGSSSVTTPTMPHRAWRTSAYSLYRCRLQASHPRQA